MKEVSHVVGGFQQSVFATFSKLAREHGAVNLSQGYPDFEGPEWVRKLLGESSHGSANQYAPFPGNPELRQVIANTYDSLYKMKVNPANEIIVTNGATQAIFVTIMALVNPGDEVIVLEPFYDSYVASVQLAGGKPVPVTLKAPDFSIDFDELRCAITSKTKMILFNNPHNPSGRVFSRDELENLATVCRENDLYIMSDEVYEHLVFDGLKHTPMATLTGMSERTITISSVGKTFGLTGWKLGWAIAAPEIAKAIGLVVQYNTFCTHHPTQIAISKAMSQMSEYLVEFRKEYQSKRDFLANGLKQLGLNFIMPKGTYFLLVECPEPFRGRDIDFCHHLIQNHKIAAIPPSAFYLKSEEGKNYIRLCFAKTEETLRMALELWNK